MPNWQTLESKDRLLAALLAANDDKKLLDYCRLATYYGDGATCATIREQFRKIRKDAEVIKEEFLSGAGKDPCSAPVKPTKPLEPKKKAQSVLKRKAKKSTKKGVGKTATSVKKRILRLKAGKSSDTVTQSRGPGAGKESVETKSQDMSFKQEFDDRDREILDDLNDPDY